MATKYCDVSLGTGLNDGTSTANAWQSLVDVLDGTPVGGSYAAGDVIIIRTADGGGDLSESTTAALSTPEKSSSVGNPVEWRFDDGTTWAQSGTFRLSFTTSGDWLINPGNIVDAGTTFGTYGLEVELDGTADQDHQVYGNVILRGVHFTRGTTPSSSNESRIQIRADGVGDLVTFYNCKIDLTTPKGGGANPTAPGSIELNLNHKLVMENCEVRLNSAISTDGLFASLGTRHLVEIINVIFTNTASTHYFWVTTLTAALLNAVVFRIKSVDLGLMSIDNWTCNTTVSGAGNFELYVEQIDGAGGFWVVTPSAWYEYDPSGNFPTLNATLPDVGTSWSVRVFPHSSNVRPTRLAVLGEYSKWYNATAATKDIRLELLIRDTSADTNAYDSPQQDEWWVEISYIDDATGTIAHETSYSTTGALATSTAGWSATTYGADNYDKYKIVVTTSNSIKQYTFVTIKVYSDRVSGGSSDFYFIDPDFQIE